MTSLDKLREALSSAPGQEAYLRWLSDDITQLLLAAAREIFAKPRRSYPGSDCMDRAQTAGESVGADDVLTFLSSPTLARGSQAGGEAVNLRAMYGAEQIMKEAGYHGDEK